MPIYEIKNTSKNAKVGIWKITESSEELIQTFKNKGFDTSALLATKNQQRLKQWLAIRLLLSEFFEDVTIVYDDLGKPHLDNNWFISISHSNHFVAIAINEKTNCGIDIEKISPKIERIKHKFLNHLDLKNVTSLSDLTTYWGAKEALYKFYGKKEVLFIENLFIEGFSKEKSFFKGRIELEDFKITIPMTWKKIEDYVLVYTL
jgi:4'-phosphopantetheinyl transferase